MSAKYREVDSDEAGSGSKRTDDPLLPPTDTLPPTNSSKSIDESYDVRAKQYIAQMKVIAADDNFKKGVACFLKYCSKPILMLCYFWMFVGKYAMMAYKTWPANILRMIFGVALCFFGGFYFVSIAAIEAARNFGGQALYDEAKVCWKQGKLAYAAVKSRENVDEDNDGVADVKQMSWNELMHHNAKVSMIAVTEPDRLLNAVQFLFSAYLSIIAVLKFEFAKTIALALAVAEILSLPSVRLVGPVLAMAMGEEIKHWVPTIIITIIKILAVVVACYIQAYISAFYSGLRGGKLFAVALLDLLGEKGVLDKMPDAIVTKPYDANSSYLDVLIGYPLAAAGFYWQVTRGFSLGFPWQLALFPLDVVEYFLRWEVFHP